MLKLTGSIKVDKFRFYSDIKVRVRRADVVTISGAENDVLLAAARIACTPNTLVSIDGAPDVRLSSLTTPRRKNTRSLKVATSRDVMTVICDGVEKVVPVVKPVKVTPEHATFQTGNPVAESTRRELLNDWHALGYSDDVPTASGFRKAADAMEKSGENFKAEALRIAAKLCEKYF